MSNIEIVPISELVEDHNLYPRHNVDSGNVASLALALEAGAMLPPIIADRASKRIVDGWHRVRAFQRILGNEATISVEWREYDNETDLLADSIRLNASHGRRLNGIDFTRSAVMLSQRGVPKATIAVILNVPERKVEKLTLRLANAPGPSVATVPGTTHVTLKHSVKHLQGKDLTPEQVDAHRLMSGTSFALLARQIITALQHNMIDLNDEKVLQQFEVLRDELLLRIPLT